MKPAGHIKPQPWMTAAETRAVVAALQAEGQAVRFVGGCVRDSLLGRKVKDVDIATPDSPETVLRLLNNAGLKAVPTGLEHGTVTAVSDHHPFEITTLREDVETYGRRARVAFTDDWTADAARRDFTMNAMFLAPDGTVYDPFGGWRDLEAGRVRFVGDPSRRIEEDYLRLLRFFRFHAHYGQGDPDPAGLEAAAAFAPHLKELSGERIREELLRLLNAPDPAPVLLVMTQRHVLDSVLPEATVVRRLSFLTHYESQVGAAPDPIRRLAALLDTDRAGAEDIGDRLRFARREKRRLADLVAPPRTVRVRMTTHEVRVALYHLGRELVRDLLLLDAAGRHFEEGSQRDRLANATKTVATWTPPRLPVGGADARAIGIRPGPAMGRVLRAVESWWEEQDFAPDRDACMAKLRELAEREA